MCALLFGRLELFHDVLEEIIVAFACGSLRGGLLTVALVADHIGGGRHMHPGVRSGLRCVLSTFVPTSPTRHTSRLPWHRSPTLPRVHRGVD